MTHETLYRKTVDILYDAYFNDTLQHTNCFACAVGNIVAGNCGIKLIPNQLNDIILFTWEGYEFSYHVNNNIKGTPTYYLNNHLAQEMPDAVKKMQEKTGYSFKELEKIEEAFENSFQEDLVLEEAMFNGLVAVLEVLKKIHQVEDNEQEVVRFKKHYQTLK